MVVAVVLAAQAQAIHLLRLAHLIVLLSAQVGLAVLLSERSQLKAVAARLALLFQLAVVWEVIELAHLEPVVAMADRVVVAALTLEPLALELRAKAILAAQAL